MLQSLKTYFVDQNRRRKSMRQYNAIVNITDPRVRDEVLAMRGR